MPQIVSCPDCSRKLRVPEHLLGKNVKCPGCGQKFLAKAAAAPEEAPPPPAERRSAVTTRRDDAPKSRPVADEERDEDYPVTGRPREDDDDRGGSLPSRADVRLGWERVRFGINLVILAVWVGVGTVGVALSGYLVLLLFGAVSFASIFSGVSPGGGPMTQQQANQIAGQAAGTGAALLVGVCAVWAIVLLLVLAQVATRLTGLGFCMAIAPTHKTQGLKGLAIAVFSLAVATLILPLMTSGAGFALSRNGGGCLMFGGQMTWAALSLGEVICFLLFLRGVAVVMKKDGLAQNIVFFMVSLPIYVVIWVLMGVFMFIALGAAVVGAASSSGNASSAAGNAAGAGAAVAIGGLTCGIVLLLIGVALFVWYVVLLYQVRGAVDRWLDRN